MTCKIEKFILKQTILFLRTLGLRKNICLATHSLDSQLKPGEIVCCSYNI